MEYYNKTDTAYLSAVSQPHANMVYKIQPLDHWENAIGEITKEISRSKDFGISANNENGVRRSCSFSLVNTDGRFTLSKNADFWYNRKFRITAGVKCGDDIYNHSQGVFICEGSNASGDVLSLTGIDKLSSSHDSSQCIASMFPINKSWSPPVLMQSIILHSMEMGQSASSGALTLVPSSHSRFRALNLSSSRPDLLPKQ